ncbi:fimbrial protein [Enterobacter ludwigii]|jgi:type 1 fimbria pilin|uniref:fimbrial protein n=1 Tax=Enterobacter ludwigii TaxID=299767 RepID=UPI0013D71B4B|nr:fimbrial protein [Enterobacter ludwigii]ELV2797979.1 fimbrial protein [Enterobacter ludwigii]
MTRMNIIMLLPRSALIALVLLAWQVSHQALADVNINFSGTLVNAPNCTINGNNTVDVDFGDNIITRQVDGQNFRQPIVYDLNCSSIAVNGMKVSVRGNPATFGSGLIDAGKTGLAIQLWEGTNKISNGVAVSFTWPAKPELYATPVAQDNTTLTAGHFSSTASLVLSYE